MINAVLDAAIIILLVVAMLYGYRLNRRITVIQQSRKELGELFRVFDQTILKAHASVEDLKHICDTVSGHLQTKIDQASLMADDLSFIAERAGKLMDDMEQAAKEIQAAKKSSAGAGAAPANANHAAAKDRQAREKALETLLEEISKKHEERPTAPAMAQEQKPQKPHDKIAHMLKALGYGNQH